MTKQNYLTVNIITYNHEKFISKCIESVLMQKTNYNFLIRIFDDCSTDKTLSVCNEYAEKYPEIICVYPNEKNTGSCLNALRSYENIGTKYYMYIEGDDYILNDKRFQMQISTLEKHKECSFCAGRSIHFNCSTNELKGHNPFKLRKGIYSMETLEKDPTLQIMTQIGSRIVRSSCINIDEQKPNIFIMDITQMFELLKQGPMFYIDENFMQYNMTNEGVYTGISLYERIVYLLDNIKKYDAYTSAQYTEILLILLKIHIVWNIDNILDEKYKIKNNWEFPSLKKIKHYFIPRFILDLFDIPRDIIRLIKRINSNNIVRGGF